MSMSVSVSLSPRELHDKLSRIMLQEYYLTMYHQRDQRAWELGNATLETLGKVAKLYPPIPRDRGTRKEIQNQNWNEYAKEKNSHGQGNDSATD